ncbi:MAG: hypothetical protein ACYC3X_14525 [Pirellulaceae bacterium]
MKTTMAKTIAYKRLRAPREDGESLCDPPLAEEAAFLDQNLALRQQADLDLGGRRLSELQAEGRRFLLDRARAYTAEYRDVAADDLGVAAPLILVGHQPDLVHPGVWFKNFVLSSLAERTAAHAVNLLIDNDAVRTSSIRVPTGALQDPVTAFVDLDDMAAPVPFEERDVRNPATFESFGQRVTELVKPLIPQPLIHEFWPRAVAASRRHGNLGRALAEARHILEGQWGLTSLELPLSQVCDSWPFRWFAACLFHDAERLREVHNRALAEYRHVNRVRSHTHPVPDLARHDDWVEVPFWLWTRDAPQRRPVFVRREATGVVLTDRRGLLIPLTWAADEDIARCVEQLGAWHAQGVRLRPRAVVTTMFARLVLSDIFIHGIGGAKYDQLTDAIVRRFFAVEPPGYLVATATLKLPLPRHSVEEVDIARIELMLRELRYHPELHVDGDADALHLVAEKRHWVAQQVPSEKKLVRHAAIERVNHALRALLHGRQTQLIAERNELRLLRRKQAILDSREYPFCLYPAETLRTRLLELSRQEP